jgi:protein-tyrosine phosphatase
MPVADFYWVEAPAKGRLAVSARPRSGEWLQAETLSWKEQGLDTIVSLLEDEEIAELGLILEDDLCATAGLNYLRFPIKDRGVPTDRSGAIHLGTQLAQSLVAGKNILIHCRAGIGRTGLFAAAILVLAGADPEEALSAVGRARHVPVPDTAEQREWVLGLRP